MRKDLVLAVAGLVVTLAALLLLIAMTVEFAGAAWGLPSLLLILVLLVFAYFVLS
jgi:hypothetical protein